MNSIFLKSDFYKKPIEVANINNEVIVIITDDYDRETIFSWYDLELQMTKSWYINKCLLWSFVKKIPKNVLIIWFWWWAFAKYLEDHISDINITWVEIDQTMIDISKKIMWVKTNDLYIKDAIIALDEIIEKDLKFDSILVDVYWSNWEIPSFFLSEDFVSKLKQILFLEGTISINFSNWNTSEKILSEYKKMHFFMLKYFSKFYSCLLEWEENYSNMSLIYNLDRDYYKEDFHNNYLKQVSLWNIIYDDYIIGDLFVDNTLFFDN